MDNNSRILDDITRVAGGAFTVLSAIGKQVQSNMKDQFENNFVGNSPANDDMERLTAMVSKLRTEQEAMKKRIAELEDMVGKKPTNKAAVKKATPKKKSTSKKK